MNLPIRNSRIRLSQGQLFWREVGRGPVLVFLHGSWSDSSQWLPVIEHLCSRYQCLAPDLLGFGESERPRVAYSIALEAECLAEFLEVLRLRPVYLVATEVGAWVAAHYALQHLEAVRGLVLLAPEGVQTARTSHRWAGARWATSKLPLALWLLRAIAPLARWLGRSGIDHLLHQRPQWMQSPVACKLLFQRRRAAFQAELLTDKVSGLKLPLLIVQGDRDSATTVELNRVYATAPEATRQLISGDYPLTQTNPEAIAQQIDAFVTRDLANAPRPRVWS